MTNSEAAIYWEGATPALRQQARLSIGEKAMRSILALSLLITLCGSANAATVHRAHRGHAIVRLNQGMIASDPASSFAYTPPGPSIHYRSAPYNEPYFGASQGYAPGEKERFLGSVRSP